ncbi:MAG: alpha-galactosidase [Roseburia sp.]|nr:alpha-galactosidase [Roseburia sp.]
MIITDDDFFYMTGGEMCYSVVVKDGRLCRAYFGKRVEREDDLAALGGETSEPEFPTDGLCAIEVFRREKKLRLDFVFDGYEVTEKPSYEDMPVLRGGKTLKLSLKDDNARIVLDLYYTPYSRGGIARRAVLKNIGDVNIRVGKLACATVFDGKLDVGGEMCGAPLRRNKCNFACASDGATEYSGDVYGMLLLYGGNATLQTECDGRSTRATLGAALGDEITLGPDESFVAPETLCVFSDVGFGGVSRAFHDIIRDEALPENFFARRRPVTLCTPTEVRDTKKLSKTISAASELGADVFVADGDGLYNGCAEDIKYFKRVAEECAEHGIKLGIAVDPRRVESDGVIYEEHRDLTAPLPSGEQGGYALDFSRDEAVELAFSRLMQCVSEYGAEYILLKGERADGGAARYPDTLGKQRLINRLYAAPEIAVERAEYVCGDGEAGGFTDGGATAARSAALPLCVLRNIVSIPSDNGIPLKSRFDAATFGSLGYELDPSALGEDARRAIRAQVFSYQDDAATVVTGDLYRQNAEGGEFCFMAVTGDKSKAYAVCLLDGGTKKRRVKFRGLDEHAIYRVRELNKTFSGAALSHYGITVENASDTCGSLTFHFGQVADYE